MFKHIMTANRYHINIVFSVQIICISDCCLLKVLVFTDLLYFVCDLDNSDKITIECVTINNTY